MNRIQTNARDRLSTISCEPFFGNLAQTSDVARSLQILPYVTFWSNVFQDIIALNLNRVRDPTLRRIVQTHYDEDVGHNLWLAEDLRLVFRDLPDVLAIFDPQYLAAREFSYAFMAEVYYAESDWERVALPIVLEEGGKIFLPALIDHFERIGFGQYLRALGRRHAQTEAAHEIHGDDVSALLGATLLPEDARARCGAMIERCRGTFSRFAAVLNSAISRPSDAREHQIRRRLDELADGAA